MSFSNAFLETQPPTARLGLQVFENYIVLFQSCLLQKSKRYEQLILIQARVDVMNIFLHIVANTRHMSKCSNISTTNLCKKSFVRYHGLN